MTARYIAHAADMCGVFYESDEFTDIDDAIECAVEAQQKYAGHRRCMVTVSNIDAADIDCPDGLTEEERELVDEALSAPFIKRCEFGHPSEDQTVGGHCGSHACAQRTWKLAEIREENEARAELDRQMRREEKAGNLK